MSESQLFLVKPRHIVSVDLGQSRSQSVVSVIRQSETRRVITIPGIHKATPDVASEFTVSYELVALNALPRGTSYLEVVNHIATLMIRPALVIPFAFIDTVGEIRDAAYPHTPLKPWLVVDAGGLGVPVIEQMTQRGLRPRPIILTSATSPGRTAAGVLTAPKRDVISTLRVCMENGSFTYGPLKLRAAFERQLENFMRLTKDSGADLYEARSGRDDFVLSVSMGMWYAAHQLRQIQMLGQDLEDADAAHQTPEQIALSNIVVSNFLSPYRR